MKTLLIQYSKSKFIQNAIYSNIPTVNTIGLAIRGNLYQTYYSNKPEYAIFTTSNMTEEIVQFISDFSHSSVKCFIYHDTISFDILETFYELPVMHISPVPTEIQNNKIITIPKNLINSQLFYYKNQEKHPSIVCFLDDQHVLSDHLLKYLYPNTLLPIKLFNNPNMPQYQNLGMLDEHNRASVLQENKYYLSFGPNLPNDYSTEAKACGCSVLSLDTIDNYLQIGFTPPPSTVDYTTFITESILI